MPIEVLMPALSPTMTEGNLSKWTKKEGDTISAGDVIAEIETDKATMEVEAVDEGTLGKILVNEGTENVQVNDVIALILEEGEDKKALDDYQPPKKEEKPKEDEPKDEKEDSGDKNKQAASSAPTAAPNVAPQATKAPTPSTGAGSARPAPSLAGGRVKASPLAKRIAMDEGVDLGQVQGTGPHGRIIKADVEDIIARGGTGGLGGSIVRRNPVEFETIPNNNMRKVIARRLLESKQQVPHFYLTVDCRIDAMLELRKTLNDHAVSKIKEEGAKPAYKISVNDMVIKAVGLALHDVPEANASWYDDAVVQYNNVDVSVAVATDGGLITPIIKNADQKALPQISNEMKDLAKRARENSLKPEEFQGGGFSVSNLGMYGVKTFQAIINPPQACILAVGAGEERVVSDGKGGFETANYMSLTLSVDHRAVDGALGAIYLQALKKYIEQPVLMLV